MSDGEDETRATEVAARSEAERTAEVRAIRGTMATFGTISEFVEEDEDWTEYVERLEHFFLANGIDDADKRRSILLSVCGAKTYKLMRNLASPRKPGELTFGELVKLVQDHHCPKPSVIVQRFRFNKLSRKSGQSVAQFVAELHQFSEHCEYGQLLEDMLRDRFVVGINDERMQRCLLKEATLTFKRAFELAQGMEMAVSNVKDIQKACGSFTIQAGEVHQVGGESDRPETSGQAGEVHQVNRGADRSRSVECFRCGGGHYANNCKCVTPAI